MTTTYSDIAANQIARGAQTFNRPDQLSGELRVAFFTYTQAATGSAGDLVVLFTTPPGSVRLLLPLSRIYFSAWGGSGTMDLGWLAYSGYNVTTGALEDVDADPNGLDDGVDISSAGSVNPGGTVGTHETYRFNSVAGVSITAQINDEAPAASDALSGYLIYVAD